MKKLLIRRISLVTLMCFFSLLLTDGYPLPAQEDDGLSLVAKGEADYGNGLYQNALDAFNQAMVLVQKNENRERLLFDISLVHYALGDKEKCMETLRASLELNPTRQIDMNKFSEGFIQLYGQANWQVQEAKAEQKKLEEQKQATARLIAAGGSGVLERTQPKAQIKKKKFPWLLAILGVGVVAGFIFLLTKKKTPKANYTLTVTKGTGVAGTPDSGTFTYVQDEKANYSYTAETGYVNVEVTLNGSVVAASGSITMDKDYELAATAKKDTNDYDTQVLGITWIAIPAGEFKMGDKYDLGEPREQPVHTVSLDAYSIAKYEVTFAQYDKFCTDTNRSKPSDNGWGRGSMPVVNVSWSAAKAFCDWLAAKTGKKIHLVTEAQWERAAAGTDQRKYPWGGTAPTCAKANYKACGGSRSKPVGSCKAGASAAGVNDMAGNVWEWVLDWHSDDYYEECLNAGTVKNPQGPASGSFRVLRSGSYTVPIERLRCAFRDYNVPTFVKSTVGFRIAMDQ